MHITTGEAIRRIRKSLGMTQSELGAILGYTQPAISQLENGSAAVHDVRVLRRVAKALQVPLAILVVESDEEADVKRRNFLRTSALGAGAAMTTVAIPKAEATTSTVSGTIRVGASDVADISGSTNQIHELDLIVGGDRLCQVAANGVRYVEQLLDCGTYTDAVGRSLTSAAAEMMTAAGWVHYDAGHLDAARRYYATAVQAATAGGDGIAAAHALGNASCMLVGRPGDGASGSSIGVQYAQAASQSVLREGGPKLRSLMALREAEAQGARGDKRAMSEAISRSSRAYESSRGHDPEWVYLSDAELRGITGKAHMWLGDHDAATTYFNAAIESSSAWPRERTGWQLNLAHNLVESGDPAQASWVLSSNFGSIQDTASTRIQQRVDVIVDAVRPHMAVSEVREFLAMVADTA